MTRTLALLVLCLGISGCFVFDELDAGDKILEQNKAKPADPAATADAQKAAGAPAGDAWWAKAKSLSDTPAAASDDPAITCEIGRSVRFMRKSDCLSQGGRPAR
jgi:hypothetical protein